MPKRYANVNNINIYLEFSGELKDGATLEFTSENPCRDSERLPVIMVHGWTADRYRNYPIFQHLASNGWPVACYDLRGHGWSQKGLKPSEYTLKNCIADLHALLSEYLLKKFGSERCYLYGHSMGGSIALKFSCEYPEIVEKLVLAAPFLLQCVSDDMLAAMHAMLESYDKRFESEFRRKKRQQAKLGLEFFPHWKDETLFPEKNAVVALGRDMLDHGISTDRLERLDIPTMIIIGKKDRPDLKKAARVLDDHLARSRLHLVDSGHAYAIELRNSLPAAIEKFLQEPPVGTSF